MFVTSQENLGFIHIPRTGGTSVTMSVAKSKHGVKQVCRTHALYKEFKHSQPNTWFATIRHPAARLHSGFYYQIDQDRKRTSGALPLKSDLTLDFLQDRINLFLDHGFESTVTSNEFFSEYKKLKRQYNIKSLNVLEQMQSISEYIDGCKNVTLFDIDTESKELFDWIKQFVPGVEYTHINNKNKKSDWKNEMSTVLVKYISDKYNDDLNRFGYKL